MIFNIFTDIVPDELQGSGCATSYDKGEIFLVWNDLKILPRKGTLIHLAGGEAGVHPCRSKELSQRKEGSSGEKGQGFCGLCLECQFKGLDLIH